MNTLIDLNNRSFYIPYPVEQFLFDYRHSTFIECRRDLSILTAKKVKQNKRRQNKVMNTLIYLTSFLESIHISYAILEGTLLGMY